MDEESMMILTHRYLQGLYGGKVDHTTVGDI